MPSSSFDAVRTVPRSGLFPYPVAIEERRRGATRIVSVAGLEPATARIDA